ncbi:MAG: AzlD domain-containing protein [Marinosulfonomonas sp.]|nr:AzlD domain-containing protein [Marinosulfonomonas sp.]
MTYSTTAIWVIIIGIGLGTYMIRFSFMGALGRARLPEWAMRLLRYTPVAVIPGLIAPMVLWPAATAGEPDPARIAAALAAAVLGVFTKNVVIAVLGGAATLYLMLYLIG